MIQYQPIPPQVCWIFLFFLLHFFTWAMFPEINSIMERASSFSATYFIVSYFNDARFLSVNIHWTERITNNEVRSRTQHNNHYFLTQSAPDAFASLVTSAELIPVRIILRHCTPVLLVCPSTGGEDPAGQDRPGYELSRMIYGHSIWVWRQLNGVLRTEQLGRHSWKRLRR